MDIDAIDLKCLVTTKGLRVDPAVYQEFSNIYNISPQTRRLTCMILSNGYVTPFNDVESGLSQLGKRYHYSREEMQTYRPQLVTPFHLRVAEGKPALFFHNEFVDYVTFPKKNSFYDQRCSSERPFLGTAVLQGNDAWLTFGCEWPCEFAMVGEPCQFCHSGNETTAQTRNNLPTKTSIDPREMCDIINYALNNQLFEYLQITGGSTFNGDLETHWFRAYLDSINEQVGRKNILGDIVFYLTPPKDLQHIDYYLANGVDKLGVSVEVWDEDIARVVTPGKIKYVGRERYLKALEYIVNRFDGHHAFCQFVVGCEPIESLRAGALWLAERGITPVFSILQQNLLAIDGNVTPPNLEYYQRAKEVFLELYRRYDLHPAERVGENGCLEIEFYNEAHGIDYCV
jgi:hypothetical protein